MYKKDHSILSDLTEMPWYWSAGLSAFAFIGLKWVLPALVPQGSLPGALVAGVSRIAYLVALAFLLPLPFSLWNSWRKRSILNRQKDIETLRSMDWRSFEALVGEFYRRQGYRVVAAPGNGPDGGVDLILHKNGRRTFVQCKHWKAYKVGVKVVRELYGVVAAEKADNGIVVSSGYFTTEAVNFANVQPLELIDGPLLLEMIRSVKVGRTDQKALEVQTGDGQRTRQDPADADTVAVRAESAANGPLCPKCGSKLVLRTARQGKYQGRQFWGCSKYPECRYITPTPTQ
jgi:restriction system protein